MNTKLRTLLLCLGSCLITAAVMYEIHSLKLDSSPTSLSLESPTRVAKGDDIEVKATVKNPSWFLSQTIYQWKVLNSKGEIKHRAVSDGDIFIPAGLNNDKFYFICSAVTQNNYIFWQSVNKIDIQVKTVSVGDGPTPTPTPNPDPAPTPVTDPLYVVAVFDNTTATTLSADQNKLSSSTTIVKSCQQLNATWKNYDKTNPALADPSWQNMINQVGLPSIFIMRKDGHSFTKKLIPKDGSEDFVINELKVLRGTK